MDEMIWAQSAIEEGRKQARCPGCRELLVRDEAEGIQVEACPSCAGLWFDGGELKALAQKRPGALAGLEYRHHASPTSTSEGSRPGGRLCPVCQVPMREFELPWVPGVRLDGCDGCQGIWADDGELTRIEAMIARHRRESAARAAQAAGANAARVQAFQAAMVRPDAGAGQPS